MPRSKQYEQPVQNEESALQNHGQIGVPYSSGHNEAFQSNVMRGIAATILLIAIGSTAYHFIEGWSWIDSIYFSSTTLTTVGFGDMHPTHDVSKIFTVFFVFAGVSVVFYTITKLGAYSVEQRLRPPWVPRLLKADKHELLKR